MAKPVFIAVNQTASDIVLDQLRLTVPGSGSVTLSDFNDAYKIQADAQLYASVNAGDILINDGSTTLTKPQSLAYLTPTASLQVLTNVESGADVTDWTNVSAALGGQAGANANYVFKSNGSGGGSMVKNLQVTPQRLTVSTAGDCDYTSIASAVAAAYAGGASATVPWEIEVRPGSYTEPPMSMYAGITVHGTTTRLDTVYVTASNAAADLFTFVDGGSVSGLHCKGVTDSAKAIFRVSGAYVLAVLHGVEVGACSNGLIVESGASAIGTYFSVNVTGPAAGITGCAMKVTGSGSYLGLVSPFCSCPAALLPYYATNPVQTFISVNAGASMYAVGGTMRAAYKDSTADIIFADGGSTATLMASEIANSNNALHIGSSGTGTKIVDNGCSFTGNVLNIKIEAATGKRFTNSTVDAQAKSLVAGSEQIGFIQYRTEGVSRIIGATKYRYEGSDYDVDLADYFADFSTTGVCNGGEVTAGTGLHVNVALGDGWVSRGDPYDDAAQFAWAAAGPLLLTASTTNYVIYDSGTTSLTVQTSPPSETQILLATVVTDGSGIRFLHDTRTMVDNPVGRLSAYLLTAHKTQLNSGLGVVQGTGVTKLNVSSGSYYLGLNIIPYGGSGGDATWSYFYGTNGATEVSGVTSLNTTQYDAAGTLTAMTGSYFRSDTLYLTSDGRLSLIYGTAQYATQPLAEAASLGNAPTFIGDSAVPLCRAIVQQGVGIATLVDARPTWGGGGGGAGGVSVHSALAGLSADDHTQYLLVTGARAMSGALNMGGNAITSVGQVDGVTVSAHASRHNPGGSDALATGTPVAVSVGASPAAGSASSYAISDHQHGIAAGTPSAVGTANAAGSASSVARSDHVHDHGAQTSGTLHAAVIAGGASGFMTGVDKTKLDGISASAAALTASAPEDVTKAAASVGVATTAARADHKHDISTAAPTGGLGSAAAEGSATSLARSDHTHDHGSVRQLIHFIKNGPAEGFASGAYRETLPAGSAFPTSVIWWTTTGKTVKIVEKLITWSGAFPSQIVWKVYSAANALLATVTDAYDYSGGNLFTPKITRTIA